MEQEMNVGIGKFILAEYQLSDEFEYTSQEQDNGPWGYSRVFNDWIRNNVDDKIVKESLFYLKRYFTQNFDTDFFIPECILSFDEKHGNFTAHTLPKDFWTILKFLHR